MKRHRRGLSLVEVMVALLLSGLVVLLAHRLFAAATYAATQLGSARLELNRQQNARRWLANTFLSLEAGGPIGAFEGEPERMAFAAWTEQPEGWLAPERIELHRADAVLIATGTRTGAWPIADSVADVIFDYLLEPGEEARWVQTWKSPVSAPLAVRLRLSRARPGQMSTDTILFLIKGRG